MGSLTAPEEVMALVILIIVQAHKGILLLSSQCIIDGLIEHAYTGMVHLRLFGVLEKEYATNQTIESITDPETVLIMTVLEIVAYFLLGIVFSLNIIETIASRNQEVSANILSMNAEKTALMKIFMTMFMMRP